MCIVGLGLIGGSLAGACARCIPGLKVTGVDTSQHARQSCLSRGWASDALAPDDLALADVVRNGCDLVVLAVPASQTAGYFRLLDQWGYQGVVTDTASTKQGVCRQAQELLSNPSQFIPGHPMAGSEVNGIDGARDDLFEGAHWILCPDAQTPPESYAALHDFLSMLSARVVSLPRDDHDQAMAIVSHVPHVVAASLVKLAARHAGDQQALFRLAAGGFKDSTRIAAGSADLWSGISMDNREALSCGLGELSDIVAQFRESLDEGNKNALVGFLDEAAQVRRALPASWVPSTDDLLEVRIPMQDRTGVVAEVTTIASQVGCNIQSIEIDHVTADSAVLSMILTDEGDVGKLSTMLVSAGFAVSLAPLSAKEYRHAE